MAQLMLPIIFYLFSSTFSPFPYGDISNLGLWLTNSWNLIGPPANAPETGPETGASFSLNVREKLLWIIMNNLLIKPLQDPFNKEDN